MRRRLEPGIECKQIAKCGGGGGGGGSSAIWLLLGHQLDALIFFVVWHPPITPTNPSKSHKREWGGGGGGGGGREEGPIVTIFTLGQNNPLVTTNTCAHIHKAIESQSLWPSPIRGFPHKELPIGWSLRFLHTKNCSSCFWGFLLRTKNCPSDFWGFFCGQRICPSDFWGFFANKEFAHLTLKGFAY